MNQATTAEEKEIYGRQVVRSKGFRSAQPLKEAQFNYYSKWFFIPIRELVGSKNFKSDPKWVAKTLNPSVSSEDAAQAISELHALGLIEEDASGRFTQTNQVVDTGDEVTSAPVAHFHREMMTKAMESIDRFPSIEREISSASVGISEKNSKKIKTLIQKYRKELLSIAAEDQEIDRIYQINFQFFPLSEKLTKDPK